MSDTTQTTNQPAASNDDPLQVDSIISEAFQVSSGDAIAAQEEGAALEALAQSYQTYVLQYTETFAQTWEDITRSYQTEVESWQAEMAKAEAAQPAQTPNNTDNTNKVLEQIEALKNRLAGAGDDDDQAGSKTTTAAKPAKKKS